MPEFVERRKQYRLPFGSRLIFTDGKTSLAAYAGNISRGGLFVLSLDPFPIDTIGYLMFFLPGHPKSFCFRGKVMHIVFDKVRCEIDCGMGIQFMDMTEAHKELITDFIYGQRAAYLQLKDALAKPNPDPNQVNPLLKELPHLQGHELLSLRYRVNRVCTVFDTDLDVPSEEAAQLSA